MNSNTQKTSGGKIEVQSESLWKNILKMVGCVFGNHNGLIQGNHFQCWYCGTIMMKLTDAERYNNIKHWISV